MSDFETGVLVGIGSWILLGILLNEIKIWLLKRLIGKVVTDLKEQQGEILLRLEKHGDMLYCYRKDTEEFVAQAKTVNEIADLFKKKYPLNEGRILKDDAQGII